MTPRQCTKCGKTETVKWYGVRKNKITCYDCYRKERKGNWAKKKSARVYDMWEA